MFGNSQIEHQAREYVDKAVDHLFHEEDGLLMLASDAPDKPINNLGIKKPIIVQDNPSIGMGDANGDTFAMASAPELAEMRIRYAWVNSGAARTYASLLNESNAGTNLSSQNKLLLRNQVQRLRDVLELFLARSDGSGKLATVSAAAGTTITCNAATDDIGVTFLGGRGTSSRSIGQYVTIFDATGATKRNATPVEITAVDYTANTITTATAVAGVTATDIIVPETELDTPVAPVGFDFLISENTGLDYFGIPSTNRYIQPTTHDLGGALTSAGLYLGWLKAMKRMRIGNSSKERKNYCILHAEGANKEYYDILNVAPFTQQFVHSGGSRPKQDAGLENFEQTFFGIEMKCYSYMRDGRFYGYRKGSLECAKWKALGDVTSQFENANWSNQYNGEGRRRTSLERHMDWGGNYFLNNRNKQILWHNFTTEADLQLKAV